jgi:hypothetical protein
MSFYAHNLNVNLKKKFKNILIYSKLILYNSLILGIMLFMRMLNKWYPLNKLLAPATALIKKKNQIFLIYKVIQMWVMLLIIMLLL